MLEKPDIQDEDIIICLRNAYGLRSVKITFLPLGADVNTAVYHAVADDATPYFVKLRRGVFDEMSVTLPKLLSNQGISQIIPPLTTKTGQLWTSLDTFMVVLYPFVEGRDGYAIALSDRQWRDFGAALKRIHAAELPSTLTRLIQRETFSAQGRARVTAFLAQLAHLTCDDPVAVQLAAFMQANRDTVLDLVERADQLAQALVAQLPPLVVCHSDIHPGNLLIDVNDRLYIVDWDNPILAPKERDLMFIGGGQGFIGHTAHEEEALFYQGYGQTQIDPRALAYYRYERIIQDIAEYCEQLLLTEEGGADREQSLRYVTSNFLPGNTIEIAYTSDQTRKDR